MVLRAENYFDPKFNFLQQNQVLKLSIFFIYNSELIFAI